LERGEIRSAPDETNISGGKRCGERALREKTPDCAFLAGSGHAYKARSARFSLKESARSLWIEDARSQRDLVNFAA